MSDGDHQFMQTGRKKKASLELICQWILDAWQKIPNETVVHSFLKCGITNALDGSEDDALWLEEDPVEGGNTEEGEDDDGEEEDDADLFYQDERVTVKKAEWDELFRQSEDEEEFHGF